MQDALKYENGRDICGSRIIVEQARGNPRRPAVCFFYVSSVLLIIYVLNVNPY